MDKEQLIALIQRWRDLSKQFEAEMDQIPFESENTMVNATLVSTLCAKQLELIINGGNLEQALLVGK